MLWERGGGATSICAMRSNALKVSTMVPSSNVRRALNRHLTGHHSHGEIDGLLAAGNEPFCI